MNVLKCVDYALYGTIFTYGIYKIVCRVLDREERTLVQLITGEHKVSKTNTTTFLLKANGKTELGLVGDMVFDEHGRAIGFKPDKNSAKRWSQFLFNQMENAVKEAEASKGIPAEELFAKLSEKYQDAASENWDNF